MNLSIIRDPQTGVTTILLDDDALDLLDSVLLDFEEDNSHQLIRRGGDSLDGLEALRQGVRQAFSESHDDDN